MGLHGLCRQGRLPDDFCLSRAGAGGGPAAGHRSSPERRGIHRDRGQLMAAGRPKAARAADPRLTPQALRPWKPNWLMRYPRMGSGSLNPNGTAFAAWSLSPAKRSISSQNPENRSTERSAEWVPLKSKLVAEVEYDQVTGNRFRHGTRFVRWRPDKAPQQCTLEQMQSEARPSELIAKALR